MRIAIVTETWLPSVDGVVTRLSATVAQLRNAGHQVVIIAPRGAPTSYCGVPVRAVLAVGGRFPYGGRKWGLPTGRVGRYLDAFAPDVVHIVNPVLLGMSGVVAARRRHLPLIASYHTAVADYASFYRLGWARQFIWWVIRLLHNSAAVNLVTSAAARQQLSAHGVGRIELWPRGVDLDLFRPSPPDPELRRTLGGDDTCVALYVGRLAAEKQLDHLTPLCRSGSVRLVLVGDGPDRGRLEQAWAGLPVSFTGALHGARLARMYASADVFVFPSTTETLGLVLLEALASGLPIVAADSPASRELLADCPVARLYPPAEPERIADLVHELRSQDRRWQSRTARATALPWTWEVATRKLVGRYEQARTRTGSGPARPRPLAQLAKFCSVGLTNGVVDLGVFNLLLWLAPTRNPNQLVVYNTVAVVAAIINSYLLNSRWTFRGLRHTGRAAATRQRLLFLAQALLNIGINDLAVWSLARVLHDVVLVSAAGTNNAVKLVAMLTSSMVSFALLRFVVFRRHKH